MNRLTDSASLYLQQHAKNPVDWHPWGPEAIARAKKENKPIFLSIGYSTCYWCHVMEREIFENEEIAEIMNENFINIKVDREERPDIDDIYMMARNIITREGGWPNNLFLTTDLKPFYGGGTFAIDSRYGKPGFAEILDMMKQSWDLKKKDIEEAADGITKRVQYFMTVATSGSKKVGEEIIGILAKHLTAVHDPISGGFFQAPKFPQESYLLFLLDYYRVTSDRKILNIITTTLDKMAAGGIYDHVGGGFHRYSVDREWHVPHFEKMLYNQAMLAQVYTEAFEITNNPYYEYVARSTLDFVTREMTGNRGQFFSAIDAETDAVEGEYYVWDKDFLKELLTEGAYNFLMENFSLADLPHFQGHKHPDGQVLHANRPIDQMAAEKGQTYDDFQNQLDKVLNKLLLVRDERHRPLLDDKVIASWNGMMITAFARAGMVFDDVGYTHMAERAASFMLQNMVDDDDNLYRIWRNGTHSVEGFLEDYVFLVQGMLALARTTGNKEWIGKAITTINKADDLFHDIEKSGTIKGGFFFSPNAEDLIVKIKTADDSAIPSANGVMINILADMDELTKGTEWEHEVWKQRARDTLQAFSAQIINSPERYVSSIHGLLKLANKEKVKQGRAGQQVEPRGETVAIKRVEGLENKTVSSSNYVKVTVNWDKKKARPGEETILNVNMKIARDWHINTNPTQLSFMIPTSVDVRGSEVDVISVEYPRATESIMLNTGDTLGVYSDEVNIPVTIALKKWIKPGEFIILSVLVSFQVCSSGVCLRPSEQLIEMSLIVAGK